MTDTPYRTALIVGVGGGLSASVARTFAKAGMKIALAARRVADLAALAKDVGGEAFACDATKRGDVVRLFGEVERAYGAPDVVVYNASYRTRGAFIDLDPGGSREDAGGFRLRWFPCRAGGRQTHVAAQAWRYPVYRRFSEREGLCTIGAVCDGQVRAAGISPEHGARIVAAGHPRCPYRDRWRDSQRQVAPIRRTSLTACSIPTPSRKPTWISCSNGAAPGPGRSNCGHGSKGFETDLSASL